MSWKLARKDMSLLIRNPITYLGIYMGMSVMKNLLLYMIQRGR